MKKYVIFINGRHSKVMPKELVTRDFIKEMKTKGFRKHHGVVEAENEKEAVNVFNEFNDDYLNSLKDFSGNAVICSVVVLFIALVYFFS